MKEKRGKLSFPVNGDEMRVPDVTHLLCPRGHDRSFESTMLGIFVSERSICTATSTVS